MVSSSRQRWWLTWWLVMDSWRRKNNQHSLNWYWRAPPGNRPICWACLEQVQALSTSNIKTKIAIHNKISRSNRCNRCLWLKTNTRLISSVLTWSTKKVVLKSYNHQTTKLTNLWICSQKSRTKTKSLKCSKVLKYSKFTTSLVRTNCHFLKTTASSNNCSSRHTNLRCLQKAQHL